MFVTQNDDMAAKGVLHIPRWLADAGFPIEPDSSHQLFQDNAVNVSASIVAHVNDESLAVEYGVEVAIPFGEIPPTHRLQVHVTDSAL